METYVHSWHELVPVFSVSTPELRTSPVPQHTSPAAIWLGPIPSSHALASSQTASASTKEDPGPTGWGSVIDGLPPPSQTSTERLDTICSELETIGGAWIWFKVDGIENWHWAKQEPIKDLQWYIDQETYSGSHKVALINQTAKQRYRASQHRPQEHILKTDPARDTRRLASDARGWLHSGRQDRVLSGFSNIWGSRQTRLELEDSTTPSLARPKTEAEKDQEGTGSSSGVQDRQYQYVFSPLSFLFTIGQLCCFLGCLLFVSLVLASHCSRTGGAPHEKAPPQAYTSPLPLISPRSC